MLMAVPRRFDGKDVADAQGGPNRISPRYGGATVPLGAASANGFEAPGFFKRISANS
jgi:hypothetical protein